MAVKEPTKERILKEIKSFQNQLKKNSDKEERELINFQITSLKNMLDSKKKGRMKKLPTFKKIEVSKIKKTKLINKKKEEKKLLKLSSLEKAVLKRIRKKTGKKQVKKKKRKASLYIKYSNKLFSKSALNLLKKPELDSLKINLIRSNLRFNPRGYVSSMLFSSLLIGILSFFLVLFLMFFTLSLQPPFISSFGGSYILRFFKLIWMVVIFPIVTFGLMYIYPSTEKKFLETKINRELPFATIHMSAISGSLIDPTGIFKILISTKEYPTLEKEFIKLINQVNVLGYDLVSALRISAQNNPSKKLAELLNGMATTITSGGDLSNFFEKRSQSLLFEYRLEREKSTKSAETFMDIYISVVIAAPMVLMLLLMLMQISGLGIGLSTSLITLIMVLSVTMINIAFLTFLHLKQPAGA